MVWYVASVILAVEVEGIEQDEYPVFENFYLIEAVNRIFSFANAEALGREEALANQGTTFKIARLDSSLSEFAKFEASTTRHHSV